MTAQTPQSTQTLYDRDYHLWLKTTVEQLQSGDFSALDLENLIEELESVGRSEKRAIESLLTRLLEHLLKLAYWESEREYNIRGWKGEIRNFRIQIKRLLKDSPSLKPYLAEILDECSDNARKIFIDITGLEPSTLPQNNIATLEQVLDEDWFPDIEE